MLLVPTLCVGTNRLDALRRLAREEDAERPVLRSHAERGNEVLQASDRIFLVFRVTWPASTVINLVGDDSKKRVPTVPKSEDFGSFETSR